MSYTKKTFESLSLINNFLMDALVSDPEVGEKSCEEMLSVLLQRSIGSVKVVSQRIVPPVTPDHRGIRMDVEIEELIESEGTFPNMNIYDLEPHRKPHSEETLTRRNRFYQAKIDGRRLNSGEKSFKKLPNLYIINILDYDPFGYDQVCYTIKNKCEEVPELKYEDGLSFLYFITTGTKGGTENIKNMLRFIENSDSSNAVDDSTKRMYDYVSHIKAQQEARDRYMSWDADFDYEVDKARNEGRAEGRDEGDIKRLINQISKKIAKGKDLYEIADDLEEDADNIFKLYEITKKYSPDYDVDAIYKEYINDLVTVTN